MTSYLIIRRGCPFCRQMVKVVNKLNLRLPFEKRIKIVDAWELEELNVDYIQIIKKFEKEGLSKEGFPFFYADGIVIEPAPTSEQMKICLENFFEKDLVY